MLKTLKHDGTGVVFRYGMDRRIRIAIETMRRDLDKPLGVRDLARLVNLSPSRFSHLFRAHAGRTPARFLHELRLEIARVLTENSLLSVKQIMARVGFNDPSHFARDFRRRHGMSPHELRGGSRPRRSTSRRAHSVELEDSPTNSRTRQESSDDWPSPYA
jgi:transcriptional regulator GlxA family with amidase domain